MRMGHSVDRPDVRQNSGTYQSRYRKYAAQLPSELTMHGPTGCSGVQARPKSGQSLGVMAPRSTSPQRHPRGSTVGSTGTS